MLKSEIPWLIEDVESIKYIGPYLARQLRTEGIFIVEHLIDKLQDFGDPDEDPFEVKERVKVWLRELFANVRGNSCCYPASKFIDGEECAYLARETNLRGHNAILKVWRYYSRNPYRRWIPSAFRGRIERNKYPRRCKL